ncbi:MAG: hypothetical protein N2489_01585, partial [Clostridia bacterium]|nr:hypothetical protein [Clostridia bacterium]
MEFTHFWKSSTGFEAKMLQGADAVVCKGRYYLAPTDEANHIITVYEPSDASKGNWQAEHRALSAQDLISFIKQITG